MKELFDVTEAMIASADISKTVVALLIYVVGRAAIRQSERWMDLWRELLWVRAFAELSARQRRDVIRLNSGTDKD